jgi:toxin-antitoxin system PIN domain toxin
VARKCPLGARSGPRAYLTLWAFLRTNPRVFDRPLSVSQAEAAISSWLAQPAAGILEPGEQHWEILRGLVRDGQAAGPLAMDAVLAAIALEHGATVCTTDRDFSRFAALRWTNPPCRERLSEFQARPVYVGRAMPMLVSPADGKSA